MKKKVKEQSRSHTMRFLKQFELIFHPAIQLFLRIAIGLLLIYFSLSKFEDTSQWAEVIYQYRLIPYYLVNFISIITSWIEFFAGVGILFGLFTRASALLASALTFIFLSAIQINIWREVYIYCGCFRKQAYLTDVTYQNRNISLYVLLITILILINKHPKLSIDSIFLRRFKK